jgi:hypothetical protein
MAQKPVLREEVYARALRASRDVKRAEAGVGGRAMCLVSGLILLSFELELELILNQMTQKPILRAEGGCACVAQMAFVGVISEKGCVF